MNADCYYEIGHDHTICEDYALAGKDRNTYAIVCDGCSASPDVDVGARILAHAAKNIMDPTWSAKGFLPFIADKADDIARSMYIHDYALDSTLLIAISPIKSLVQVYMYGDGSLIVKKKSGEIEFTQIEFESGAPFYPAYFLSPNRRDAYFKEFSRNVKITKSILRDGVVQSSNSVIEKMDGSPDGFGLDFYDKTYFNVVDAEFVTLTSDGINTYEKKLENGGIEKSNVFDIVNMVTAYKGFHGQFVERRMKRMKKDLSKEGVSHFDDIAVATIYMED